MSGLKLRLEKKMTVLVQRENNLVLLEEELKQKILETSRQLTSKDEAIEKERATFTETKGSLTKKIKALEKQVGALENEKKNISEEFEVFRKDQETSPIQIIKNELNAKNYQILELKSQLEKSEEIKEEYRKHFERLKNEIMRLKSEVR